MKISEEYRFCEAYLGEDEEVLWKGMPEKGNLLELYDAFVIPFILFWLWEAAGVFVDTIRSQDYFFVPMGLLFLAVGLYGLCGRFLHRYWVRKHTKYVITNVKVIRQRRKKVDTLVLKGKSPIKLTMRKDGKGTIHINKWDWKRQYASPYARKGISIPGLEYGMLEMDNIADAQQVKQILDRIATE